MGAGKHNDVSVPQRASSPLDAEKGFWIGRQDRPPFIEVDGVFPMPVDAYQEAPVNEINGAGATDAKDVAVRHFDQLVDLTELVQAVEQGKTVIAKAADRLTCGVEEGDHCAVAVFT